MKEQNTSNIRVTGHGSSVGPVATGTGAHAIDNRVSGAGGVTATDVQRLEGLLDQLLEEIDQHAQELPQRDAARNATAFLRDQIRTKDPRPGMIEGTLQSIRSAVENVTPLVSLAAKVSEAIQPWLHP